MINIIIVGHGKFGEGLLSSSNLILGEQENVVAVEFEKEDSTEDLTNKIMKEIDKFSDNILFLTDLVGGTPFNVSVVLSEKLNNSRVIGGSNLPVVMQAIMGKNTEDIDSLVQVSLESGKDGVDFFETRKKNNDTDKRQNSAGI